MVKGMFISGTMIGGMIMITRIRHIKWSHSAEEVFCRISNMLLAKIRKVARELELCRRCGKRINFDLQSSSPELPTHYERHIAWNSHCMCRSCYKETNTAPLRIEVANDC